MTHSSHRMLLLVFGLWWGTWPADTWADPDGQPVCSVNGDQTLAAMAPDGQGGAFVVWLDWRESTGIDLVMQRVLASGAAVDGWPANGAVVSDAPGDQLAPCVVADGWGGAYVAWEDLRGADPDIRAQHFDPFGRLHHGWPAGGLLVCGASGVQSEPVVATDDEGRAFVVWSDHRIELDSNIYVQRVSPRGHLEPGWPADGQPMCRALGVQRAPSIVADGAGGVIVAWEDQRNDASGDIFAQRVTADLDPDTWGKDGLEVCQAPGEQETPQLAADGIGGAYVVWQDLRGTYYDIYAHHITDIGWGDWGWAVDGSPICAQPGGQLTPRVVADGSGGAIVTWIDSRDLTDFDIYALRLAAHSPVAAGWPTSGVALCTAPGDQIHPQIAGDGEGGAFVCWADKRAAAGSDVYAQRITSLGILPPIWPGSGERICGAQDDQEVPRVVADGHGRALLAWTDWRNRRAGTSADVYGRMVTGVIPAIDPAPPDGTPLAAAPGDQFPNVARRAAASVPDGVGGAYIAWEDARGGATDVFVQHVGLDGRPAPGWPPEGNAVSTAAGARSAPSLAADGEGGVYVVWQVQRGTSFEFDIDLQRFEAGGTRVAGWPAEGVAVCSAPRMQLGPRLALDANANVFVVWEDFRNGPAADVYASRITPRGTVAAFWPRDGIAVCDRPGNQLQADVIGAGPGAVIVWSDGRFGEHDLYGVGISMEAGVTSNWTAGGSVLCRASGHQLEPAVIADGSDGIIVCWIDARGGTRTPYALRLRANGNRVISWPENGVALVDPSGAGEARDLRIAGDGDGGLLATWFSRRDRTYEVRAQRRLADGTRPPEWPVGGVPVSPSGAPAVTPALASDLVGGAVIVWVDLRAGAPDVYAQRLDEYGAPWAGWDAAGRAVCTAAGSQWAPEVIATPGCGAIVCWYDERGVDADVYAVHLDLMPRATDASDREDVGQPLRAVPNPFRGTTSIRMTRSRRGDVDYDIYDVAGRCIRRLRAVDVGPGEQQLPWNGLDDRGIQVPAGVYFVRVRSSGFEASAKLVRRR